MIIDFTKLVENKIEHMRNGEGYIKMIKYVDEKNTIAHIVIPSNSSIGIHTHENDQEIIYVINGCGICVEDGITYPLQKGQSNYCAKGNNHSIKNTSNEDLELFAVITK